MRRRYPRIGISYGHGGPRVYGSIGCLLPVVVILITVYLILH